MRKDFDSFIQKRIISDFNHHFSDWISDEKLVEIQKVCISVITEIKDEFERCLDNADVMVEATRKHYQRIIDRQSIKIENLHEHYRNRSKK